MENFFIKFLVAIAIFVGFFWYWGRTSGVFKEGGVIYEYWQEQKAKKQKPVKSDKSSNNEQ